MDLPELSSPEMAEFVGILLGDGSIARYECDRGGGSFSEQFVVKVTISSEEADYEEHVLRLFRDLFGLEATTYPKRDEKVLDIRCFNRDLFEFLTDSIGLETAPKKGSAVIPELFMDEDLRTEVLRGFFDTDGSLVLTDNNGYLYPRLEMKISESPMQNQFVRIHEDEGFRFGVYDLDNDKVRVQLNGKGQLENWVEEIGFNNPRHLNKLEKFRSG